MPRNPISLVVAPPPTEEPQGVRYPLPAIAFKSVPVLIIGARGLGVLIVVVEDAAALRTHLRGLDFVPIPTGDLLGGCLARSDGVLVTWAHPHNGTVCFLLEGARANWARLLPGVAVVLSPSSDEEG